MTDRKILVPDASHPISIEDSPSTVTVKQGTLSIAKTQNALTLSEASYPPVQYIPRSDVDMSLLQRSQHTTYCPYKGVATYYSIPALGEAGLNSVWTYEAPFDAVGAIAGHLAFYPDRVSVELREGVG
ncbi:DUF427 domain-containing protein [Sphingomonas gei]|uniref:DUF427 domain-containing protein n=1 Tax=Sphingomonas gei TaxID=1395960 RepID=A0A4S1X135_9SPHN|nr:DUF427 domain-containing protein [Sphingomonas gei]TGX49599.1 DUF427 domain-containing protein [Sphingomonas gei]